MSDSLKPATHTIELEFSYNDESWLADIPKLESAARRALKKAAQKLAELDKAGETLEGLQQGAISLAFMSDAQMQRLNREYRGQDRPTNVLSFPALFMPDDQVPVSEHILGDIALARETVLREAEEKGISMCQHLAHLLIHGYLHLQGYDHQTQQQAAHMEGLEIEILTSLGIDNPYESSNFQQK